MKPTLYILCGVSACGKTTWAHKFMNEDEDVRYVSRDDIRFSLLKGDEDYFAHEKEVFKRFSNTIARTLLYGYDVIADATHLNSASRQKLTRAIDRIYKDYQVVYVVFTISAAVCKKHNMMRTGLHRVPEEVIDKMMNNFEKPNFEEDVRCIEIWEMQEGNNGDISDE